MKYYDLRTKDGGLRVAVNEGIANYILTSVRGEWVEKNFVKGGKRMVYSFTEDEVVGRRIGGRDIGVAIHIFAGDYIDINEE